MHTKETTSPDPQGLVELKEAVAKDLEGVPNKELLIKAILGFVDYAYRLGLLAGAERAVNGNVMEQTLASALSIPSEAPHAELEEMKKL